MNDVESYGLSLLILQQGQLLIDFPIPSHKSVEVEKAHSLAESFPMIDDSYKFHPIIKARRIYLRAIHFRVFKTVCYLWFTL